MKPRVVIAILFLAVSTSLASSANSSSSRSFWEEFDAAFHLGFAAYKQGQDPKVSLRGPTQILQGSYGKWIFTFTAGSSGMKAGQAVAIATRHVSGWGTSQNCDPGAPNYVSAMSSGDVTLDVIAEQHFSIFNRHFYDDFPWQHITQVVITRGRLLPGESIQLVFGDQSHGSPGFRAPSVARPHALFLAMVRRALGGPFIPVPTHLSVVVLPDKASRLSVIVPSDTIPGARARVILRAEDEQGNVAAGYRGTVTLRVQGGASNLPGHYQFQSSDQGLHVFANVRFSTPGIYRIEASDVAQGLQALSNPSRCLSQPRRLKVFWGDLHDHSVISDGTGSAAEAFKYARDVAALDFFALTDHGFMMNQTRWQLDQSIASDFNDPPRFVTFYGYEWSGQTDVGGDHNVIYDQPGLPLYRSDNYYDAKNPFEYSDLDLDAPHIMQLYRKLHLLAAQKKIQVLVIPHWRGRTANPRWNDPAFSPIVELASEAGWHEIWALGFLHMGYHLGFVGGSDDHYGRPGYGMADHHGYGYADPPETLPSYAGRSDVDRFDSPWGYDIQGSPLTAVLASENNRASIFRALLERHCYVTSGPRIILDFKADGHLMGEEFSTQEPPHFQATAETLSPITALILKKDGEALYTVRPAEGSRSAHLSYVDLTNFKGHFFYTEVLTTNPQERAISSPIWID